MSFSSRRAQDVATGPIAFALDKMATIMTILTNAKAMGPKSSRSFFITFCSRIFHLQVLPTTTKPSKPLLPLYLIQTSSSDLGGLVDAIKEATNAMNLDILRSAFVLVVTSENHPI